MSLVNDFLNKMKLVSESDDYDDEYDDYDDYDDADTSSASDNEDDDIYTPPKKTGGFFSRGKAAPKKRVEEPEEDEDETESPYSIPRTAAPLPTYNSQRATSTSSSTRTAASTSTTRTAASTSTPSYSSQRAAATSAPAAKATRKKSRNIPNNVVDMRSAASSTTGNSEVCLIVPKDFDDANEIADILLTNRAVVLNLEGLNIDAAQRIIDFTSGACYAVNGNLRKISKKIFIATPSNVVLSGDFIELENGVTIDLNSLNLMK